MKWFIDLSTKNKLFLSFGLMIVFLASVIFIAYTSLVTIEKAQRQIYRQDMANAVDLYALRSNQNGVRADLLDMMLVSKRQDQEAWHQDIKERSEKIDGILQTLMERNQKDPGFLRRLEEYKEAREAFQQTRDAELIPLIYEGKIEEAKNVALGVQMERFKKMRDIADQLGNEAEKAAREMVERSEQKAKNSILIFFVVGGVAILMGVLLAAFLNRIISTPLKQISLVAEKIAAGDLAVQMPSDHRMDEVGMLTLTFCKMVENLRRMIRELSDGINVLATSASEILASTTQVASGAAETATAVSETTATLEEVKQTSQVATQKAKTVSETAQKSALVSQTGRKSVEDTVEGINRVRTQMEAIAGSIVKLSEQSQTIGEIITSVNDLAEQSNLLAVNAAIEAAKAGEQGRGFAVVAQEVKSLAEQSKQATAQVRAILTDIQKATSAAVMATEQGSKAVEAGVRQSQESGESIRLLATSISEAAQASTQIAASSQQQLVGVDQVAQAMENIKQASTQNVAAAKQVETAAHNLHELGQRLKQLVEQYKV